MAANAKPEDRPAGRLGDRRCRCRAAVVRAFAGMTASGVGYEAAVAVALRVFHHHHPEVREGAREMVEHWVSPESLH